MSARDLERLRERLAGGQAIVAGVLSGTSADGIDVALARFDAHALEGRPGGAPPELCAFATRPFPPPLARRVRAVLDGESTDLVQTALLHRDLGRAFGRAAAEFARECGLEIELAGSHGQTVYHHDGREESGAATLQLGDGDHVAEELGCPVVSDFRQRDVAAGGEGAPLAALADGGLFARLGRPAWVLNLGGMANLTLLGPGAEPEAAFDTGPAGALLDGLARRLLGASFDEGGRAAARGRADAELVERWLGHPFHAAPAPKSTGRDTFGEAFVLECLGAARARSLAADDVLASAVEYVARSIVDAARAHAGPPAERLVVCGGGVHNRALMDALGRLAPWPLEDARELGVDPDAREALVFALLAGRCVLGIASTSPRATGAAAGRVLGKLSQAPAGRAEVDAGA